MATWPQSARIVLGSYSDEFDPSIRRTEMERGMPKQAILNSNVLRELTFTVVFETNKAANDFEDWYFNELKRIGFFDLRNPRTRTIVNARFKEAKIGTLTPITGGFGVSQRTVTVEFLQ